MGWLSAGEQEMPTTYPCSKSRAKVFIHTHKHKSVHSKVFPYFNYSCYPSGLSSSLAPPPLDGDLPVSERLGQVKACLSRLSAGHGGGVVVTYDIIQVYKTLVLSCGISLEGNCEDPKVRETVYSHSDT